MPRSTKMSVKVGGVVGDGNSTSWNTESWDEPGWCMRFDVDEAGNVSGGNCNETNNPVLKTYTGTFKANHMNVTSNHGVLYVADCVDGEMVNVVITHTTAGRSAGRGRVFIKTG
ncbi:hypothetical protein Pelo_13400 [Pelomyxa schiedti]|nr:hypothetical protein Pelo_13400 [Pelomyxa schiedti]